MQGGQGHSGSGGSHQSAALTAFVLIAMLESGLPSNVRFVTKHNDINLCYKSRCSVRYNYELFRVVLKKNVQIFIRFNF